MPPPLPTLGDAFRRSIQGRTTSAPPFTLETVETVYTDGDYGIRGAKLKAIGRAIYRIGQQVPVLWSRDGRTGVILAHSMRRSGGVGLAQALAAVEELLIATNADGQRDCYFRNAEQFTALKLTSYLNTDTVGGVAWGMADNTFFLLTRPTVSHPRGGTYAGYRLHVFQLNRSLGQPQGGTTASATFIKTITPAEIALPWSQVNAVSPPPNTTSVQLYFPADATMAGVVLTPALDAVFTAATDVTAGSWFTYMAGHPSVGGGPVSTSIQVGYTNTRCYAVWSKTGALVWQSAAITARQVASAQSVLSAAVAPLAWDDIETPARRWLVVGTKRVSSMSSATFSGSFPPGLPLTNYLGAVQINGTADGFALEERGDGTITLLEPTATAPASTVAINLGAFVPTSSAPPLSAPLSTAATSALSLASRVILSVATTIAGLTTVALPARVRAYLVGLPNGSPATGIMFDVERAGVSLVFAQIGSSLEPYIGSGVRLLSDADAYVVAEANPTADTFGPLFGVQLWPTAAQRSQVVQWHAGSALTLKVPPTGTYTRQPDPTGTLKDVPAGVTMPSGALGTRFAYQEINATGPAIVPALIGA